MMFFVSNSSGRYDIIWNQGMSDSVPLTVYSAQDVIILARGLNISIIEWNIGQIQGSSCCDDYYPICDLIPPEGTCVFGLEHDHETKAT